MSESKQTAEWRGGFGDAYIERNQAQAEAQSSRVKMWQRILGPIAKAPPRSILEVGANIGLNLRALSKITDAELYAIEPNLRARTILIDEGVVPASRAFDGVAHALPIGDGAVDLAFTSGVLIHVPLEILLEFLPGDPPRLAPVCRLRRIF